MHPSSCKSPPGQERLKTQRESPRTTRLIDDWKIRLRLQCHAQLEAKREDAKLQRRKICFSSEVIDHAIRNQITQMPFDAASKEEMDVLLKIMADLKAELMAAEERREREFLETLEFEDRTIHGMIDHLDENQVFCPICQKNYLQESSSSIVCVCGFDLKADISLACLGERLQSASHAHSQACSKVPRFRNVTRRIVALCGNCQFVRIVCEPPNNDFCMDF